MHFFLTLYRDFSDIVAMAVPANKAARESWLCLEVPKGPERRDCITSEFCTIECALSWFLQSWDVEITVDWEWPFKMNRA
jgi:hypothetical protein